MSMICKMNAQCCATKKMCIHEKMMMAVAVILGAGALGHWVLNWF